MTKFGERKPNPVTEMIVVQNWFEELKRLAPTVTSELVPPTLDSVGFPTNVLDACGWQLVPDRGVRLS